MTINSIRELCLYSYLKTVHLEGSTRQPPFPMNVLMDGNYLIAAIKVGLGDTWHVENVHAVNGYGPTIYKALMEISAKHGIAPAYKIRKEKKDYVVPKSRNIWRVFSGSPNVKTYFLEDKYTDDYMNSKFISVHGELDIGRAEYNLREHIKNEYRKGISYFEKLKRLIKKENHAKPYKQFKCSYEKCIWSNVRTFLEASVEAHQ